MVQSKSTSDLLLCLEESDIKVILSYLGFIFKAGLLVSKFVLSGPFEKAVDNQTAMPAINTVVSF